MQFADVPGRHGPGTGHIDFHSVVRGLNSRGYSGWYGLEYIPIGDSRASLLRTCEHLGWTAKEQDEA